MEKSVDLKKKLYNYVEEFNKYDEELAVNEISNADAADWLYENVPLLACPDEDIERIYYFRWWTFRKHIKNTPDGHVITEFLRDVSWSGKYNTINCATGHHIAEGKWIKNEEILKEYIQFWLDEKGSTYSYSAWLISAVYDFCKFRNDFGFAIKNIDKLCSYFDTWERDHKDECGLYWSIDDRDAMEYSISGGGLSPQSPKGFRPTLNSYMISDAEALSKLLLLAGKPELAEKYLEKSREIKELMLKYLWRDGFFRSSYSKNEKGEPAPADFQTPDVRELIGYIPWYFNIPPEGMEECFSQLLDSEGFYTTAGLTTAEQRHPRFMYEVDHECLWNGYVWPFATSQTLVAVNNLIRNYKQDIITVKDFYRLVSDYARSQYIIIDGKKLPWIDEVINPKNGEWSSRNCLKQAGWLESSGGYERGKDYNHSTFCDIVLSGLLGISVNDENELEVKPLITDEWDYFKVENITAAGEKYNISFEDGKLTVSKAD